MRLKFSSTAKTELLNEQIEKVTDSNMADHVDAHHDSVVDEATVGESTTGGKRRKKRSSKSSKKRSVKKSKGIRFWVWWWLPFVFI